MKKFYLFLLCLGFLAPTSAQEEERSLLRGTVLYRNSVVPNENVINTTAQMATITDEQGRFAIKVPGVIESPEDIMNIPVKHSWSPTGMAMNP